MSLRTFPLLVVTAVACSGAEPSQMVSMDLIEPGDDCPNGGIALSVGEDEDEDGVLDELEIAETELVCNGADGTPGEDGDDGDDGASSLIETETLLRGDANCPHGGLQIDVGLDNGDGGGTAGDAVLQEGEIDDTAYVCDGAPAYDLGLFEPPATPGSAYTITTSGGDATDGDGGDGGDFRLGYLAFDDPGLAGGHIKLFATGVADASFPLPIPTLNLGAMPLEVAADFEVPLYLDEDHDGIPDVNTTDFAEGYIYQLEGDSWLYAWTGSAGEEVTGLHIAGQATLTLPAHTDATAYLRVSQIHNEGTITAEPGASQVRNLDLRSDRYYGSPTSAFEVSAITDDIDGGTLYLYGNHVFFNEGTIAASGLGTGRGGSVEWEAGRLLNLGDVSVAGGTSTSGTGGPGGQVSLGSYDDLYTSGDITARGGGGLRAGGAGGQVHLEAEIGDVRNSGDIDVSGGDADPACITDTFSFCYGGNAITSEPAVSLRSTGGAVINAGAITATGGVGTSDGAGGHGGEIAFTTINWERAARGITVSGDLDTSGGKGAAGGTGGRIFAQVFSDTPTDAEVIFYGYSEMTLDAGDGVGASNSGGEGGDVLIKNNCPAEPYLPAGGVLNFVDISSLGGDGDVDEGGRAGKVQIDTCRDMGSLHQGGSVIINAGDITLTGGNGTRGALGGKVELRAYEWVENSGVILTSGGNGNVEDGASAGGVKLDALAGQVVNTGSVTGVGGGSTSADGQQGATIELLGLWVDNTADLTAPGGAGGAAGGLGGGGGHIRLTSHDGLSANSGTFDITVGVGNGGAGTPGSVFIDGMDHTANWIP